MRGLHNKMGREINLTIAVLITLLLLISTIMMMFTDLKLLGGFFFIILSAWVLVEYKQNEIHKRSF